MKTGKEFRPRAFALSQRFDYLPESDRYLSARPTPRYRFNVIGAGLNGREHLRVTLMEGRASIHGIYDNNPGSIAQARKEHAHLTGRGDLVVYDTLEAACNDPAVDGLVIATPNFSHIDMIRVAAKSGKHILLEKPMTTTIADAYEITQLAAGYPAVFQIGLQYRYKSMYSEAIHEALQRKAIGQIKLISIMEHRLPFLDKVKQWNKFSRFSGGTLVEKCCHYFDLLNLFAGARPVSVFASGSMAVNFIDFEYDGEKSDIIDNALVTVVYENGVRGSFNLCMFSPMFYEEMSVCGDEGHLKVYEVEDMLPVPRSHTHLEIRRGEYAPSRFSEPAYPAYIQDSGHNGATFFEHVNFVNNIEGLPTNTATVEEGFWSVVVGAAAEESIKTGQVVLVADLLKRNGVR